MSDNDDTVGHVVYQLRMPKHPNPRWFEVGRDDFYKFKCFKGYESRALYSRTPAAPSAGVGDTPEDRFEQYVQDAIARSPEPLRELGRYLANHLDEDEFPRANELILQIATNTPPQAEVHPDDLAVDRFAAAMKEKLAAARAKGRGGWDTEDATAHGLSVLLRRHVDKGDPRDVANFCMFLHQRGEAIAAIGDAPAIEWRCFHCDEVFADQSSAAIHFGTHVRHYPVCTIDAAKYREMELLVERHQEEDGPIHRLMHRQASEHAQALRRAEEAGYAKALKDTNYTEVTPGDAEAVYKKCKGRGYTDEGDHEIGSALFDCDACTRPAPPVVDDAEAVAEIVVEDGHWNNGHFITGHRPAIKGSKGWSKLPIGTKLYARPVPPVVDAEAVAWQAGYQSGVEDERTSEANIGIAGMGGKIEPARANPYAAALTKGTA